MEGRATISAAIRGNDEETDRKTIWRKKRVNRPYITIWTNVWKERKNLLVPPAALGVCKNNSNILVSSAEQYLQQYLLITYVQINAIY